MFPPLAFAARVAEPAQGNDVKRHHFKRPHNPKTNRDQLRDSAGMPFLWAMDLVLVQADEVYRTVHRRLDPADAREERAELGREKHAASAAKLAWMQAMRETELRLAEQWSRSDDPALAAIGVCLSIQDYSRLAR